MLVRPDGKIVLAGFSGPEGGNVEPACLNENGKLDATFGTGGKASVDFGGDDFGLAMARQADGRILIAGRSSAAGYTQADEDVAVARLNPDGSPDATFGRRREGDRRVRRRHVRQRGRAPAERAGSSSPVSGRAATASR